MLARTGSIQLHGQPSATSVFTLMRLGEPERPCSNQSLNTCSPSRFTFLTSTMAQELTATYHPAFNAPDADAVLSSLDNTLYHLPSSVLPCTTTFFASPSFTFEPPSKPIPIHEHDAVLERLLRILSGLAIPPWRTFDDLEGALGLAETWGARGAVDVVCGAITAPVFLREPLRVYAIAARFGWGEEAELVSKHTLDLSLHEEQHQEVLRRIPTRALVRLFKFHRKRRDAFRAGMAGEGAERRCGGCGEAVGGAGVEDVLGDRRVAVGRGFVRWIWRSGRRWRGVLGSGVRGVGGRCMSGWRCWRG
ncbi:hypothetical protein IW261DRAFT_1113704 [Armillaria novae-zelandiae]|uniref:BTB domain-containing protein n=1 Tax=Armillaria novae-zelandiae TaxID=153914 RepID=A0AA39NJ52_9AGAR|nr:hypothetical protein IW261DRAFT_1113704 [Armillaria novae-zelandiae]